MPLTDTAVRNAKPGAKPVKLPDGRGLYLLVQPAGGKLWRLKYRTLGKEKLMALGKYPDVSLKAAREAADAARRLLASGADPMAERKADKIARQTAAENSFSNVARLWHEGWKQGRNERHAVIVLHRLEVDIFPAIGHRPVSELEAPELVAMTKATAARGALDVARRNLQVCGQVFRYAIAHGLASRNPATDIKPADILPTRRQVNYARLDAKELPELLRKIEVYPGVIGRTAMKLLALTFVRTGELIGARWAEFDLENARWDIPAERMKMKTPHIVPLSVQAVDLLRALHTLTGHGPLLFPGERDHGKPMSNGTVLAALRRMGYAGRMTGHGFRGIASTILHERGFEHAHIELQLAHAERNAVSAAYNHALYLEPRARMMQAWADHLERLRAGNVITLRA
ncbi:MAG: integrase arm-type DNA-binding domain-containing protein [Proteobacteria bacterium]|nr:integrase arm-type DNA-binding domain-containing protein [Pseudomonadota bacterium]